MDTSQLMNHVVHRQLCYTLFTQVPIEPFFQLGLDFLFAGSHSVRLQAIPFRRYSVLYIVFLGFSMHPSASPSHRKSPQCITIAGQRDTVHFNAFAQRSASTQSRSFAARYPSSPFPCVSQHRLPVVPILCLAMPLFAVPLLCKSPRFYAHLSLCQASPRQADLCHRVSSRSRALPLRSQAK